MQAQGLPKGRDITVSIADQLAVHAWNLMGGRLVWSALPLIFDVLEVEDPEAVIRGLLVVRTEMEARNA